MTSDIPFISKTRSRHHRRHSVVEGAPSLAPTAAHPPLLAPLVVPLLPAVRDPAVVPRGTMERQTRITRNRDVGARRAGWVSMRKYWQSNDSDWDPREHVRT